jgi:hypothetical protein
MSALGQSAKYSLFEVLRVYYLKRRAWVLGLLSQIVKLERKIVRFFILEEFNLYYIIYDSMSYRNLTPNWYPGKEGRKQQRRRLLRNWRREPLRHRKIPLPQSSRIGLMSSTYHNVGHLCCQQVDCCHEIIDFPL